MAYLMSSRRDAWGWRDGSAGKTIVMLARGPQCPQESTGAAVCTRNPVLGRQRWEEWPAGMQNPSTPSWFSERPCLKVKIENDRRHMALISGFHMQVNTHITHAQTMSTLLHACKHAQTTYIQVYTDTHVYTCTHIDPHPIHTEKTLANVTECLRALRMVCSKDS